MRTMKTLQGIALGAVALGALALGVDGANHARRALSSAPDDRHLTFQLDYPRGERLTYGVAWRGTTSASIATAMGGSAGEAQGIDGSLDLDADLVIESYGPSGGAFMVRERIENVRKHVVRLMGQDAIASDAEAKEGLEGRSVLVALDPSGAVRGMYFAKDEAPLFQHVMQSLVTETSVTLAASHAEAWDAVEASNTGDAKVHYEVLALDPPRVERERTEYTRVAAAPGRTATARAGELSSRSTLSLDAARRLVSSVTDDEDVLLRDPANRAAIVLSTDTHFEMALRDVSTFDPAASPPPVLAQLDARTPGELAVGPRADEQIQDQRIGGLTAAELHDTLLAYAAGGLPPGNFLWRATGFLKAHPEACLDLAELFESPRMSNRGREQLLEILASVSTPEAQDAMRVALESPVAHADKAEWERLVQRFSFVQRPTTDSVAFVAASYREAKSEPDRAAAAYALGATAGNLARNGGDAQIVRAARETLMAGLTSARTATERRDMLGALGNLGLKGSAPTIASYGKDPSAEVRGAAAWALRRIDDEDARSALVTFASDASPSVATSAYQALSQQTLGEGDWRALAGAVTSGATPVQADSDLLNLLSQNQGAGEPVAQMLRAMLARDAGDNSLAARIRHVLQAMG